MSSSPSHKAAKKNPGGSAGRPPSTQIKFTPSAFTAAADNDAGTTTTASQVPTRISIENLEFMEQDQKQKELQEKVNRHKTKSKMQRHRRNESFGKTPSISELGGGIDSGDDAAIDANLNADLGLHDSQQDWLAAANNNNSLSNNMDYSNASYPYPEEPIHKKQSYMVPLQDNSQQLLQQQQQQMQQQMQQQPFPPPAQEGFVPWPAPAGPPNVAAGVVHPPAAPLNPQYYQEYKKQHRRSLSNSSSKSGTPSNKHNNNGIMPPAPPAYPPVHPLKADPSLQQPYPSEYMDDEYASLLQQNFAVTNSGGYGATAAAPPLAPTGRHPNMMSSALPHYPPKSRENSRSPLYQHHKSSSMPSYNTGPRGRTSSEERGLPPPPPPPPSGGHPHPHHPRQPSKLQSSPGGHIHRRSHSDNYAKMAAMPPPSPQQPHPLLPRGSPLPPTLSSSPGHRRVSSSGSGIANLRNNSAQNVMMGSASSLGGAARSPGRGQHKRSSSLASYSSNAVSVQSEASFLSVVSDIRKSSFYGGYNQETGQMEMHYPKEHIHLSTNKELHPGWIYAMPVDTEAFEEYHRQAEEAMLEEEDEQMMMYEDGLDVHRCTCQCPACYHGCTGHESNTASGKLSRKPKDPFQALPTTTFALAVEDSIYRNVLDEISQASTMPCGLFYCGHHEDISHPSVMIPLVFMVLLFCAMGYVAFVTE